MFLFVLEGYHVHSPSRYLGEELEEEMEVSNTEIPFSSAIPPIAECLTKFSFPPGIKLCGSEDMSSCSEEYKTALRIISGAPGFSKILAITTARCPIIKFTDSATGISCDLSINNRYVSLSHAIEIWDQPFLRLICFIFFFSGLVSITLSS